MSIKTITLSPDYERISPTNPLNLSFSPLYHQQRTYDALKQFDLVINTHNTGSGKTKAALLRLFDLGGENVLFIAPTNELIHQHAQSVREFVEENNLDFFVFEATGEKLRELEIVDDAGYELRNAKKLHNLIRNPRDVLNPVQPDQQVYRNQPLILVINPDIFYYCFYMVYSELDAQNLFRDFLSEFDYIVIDEFHYYNAKQFANFLAFFVISKAYGYFDGTRKICLLSATPDAKVLEFIERVGLSYQVVSPDNEQNDSTELLATQRVLSLSELELTIHVGKIADTISRAPIGDFIGQQLDGVVISNSLRAISEINNVLSRSSLKGGIGLITGAVSTEERRNAIQFPLVLATPTVDIGYNFTKDKKRQNIDFICFDANYGADFLQRLGRAGRLLGKTETTQKSYAHAFINEQLLSKIDKNRYDRSEFSKLINSSLPSDNQFYHYIDSYAVIEAFQILYKVLGATIESEQEHLQNVFETLRQVFAPDSEFTYERLIKRFRWHKTYEVVSDPKDGNFEKVTGNDYVRKQWEDASWGYLRHRSWEMDQLEVFESTPSEQLKHVIRDFLKKRSNRNLTIEHAQSEHHLIQSLFQFRSSELGFRCGVYDPSHLFQNTADHTYYNLFFILQNCDFQLIDWKVFHELTGERSNYCDFHVRVSGLKSPRRAIKFGLETDDDRNAFERKRCFRPVAIKNLDITLTTRGHEEPIPIQVREAFKERLITCLVSKFENRYVLHSVLETKRSIAYELDVLFKVNGTTRTYQIIIGTEAYLIHSELKKRPIQNAD